MAPRAPRSLSTRFDPFLGDRDLRRIYHQLHAGRWDEFVDALDSERQSWLLQWILTSDDAAVETVVFRRLHDALPSARTLALLAGAMVRDAWSLLDQITGDTTEDEFVAIDNRFQDELTDAEELLQKAVLMRPALADPWIHLLNSGRGLGIDLQELRTRFENAHSRAPFRPDACQQYAFGLSARRGGADAALFDMVRWVQAEAPSYSPARMVLPIAHLEFGLGNSSGMTLTEHLSRPETVAELTPALEAFLRATPADAGPAELPTLNAYALAMTVADATTAQLTSECFTRIANRPTSYPWSLYENEDIAEVFAEVQRTQLRSAERFG